MSERTGGLVSTEATGSWERETGLRVRRMRRGAYLVHKAFIVYRQSHTGALRLVCSLGVEA